MANELLIDPKTNINNSYRKYEVYVIGAKVTGTADACNLGG